MKKWISFLLCLIMLGTLSTSVWAEEDFDLGQTWDDSILLGGIFDAFAWVGDSPEDYTFQWQVDVGIGEGHWIDLEDNADPYGYRGTDTYHLELATDPNALGLTIDSQWNQIPFCCKVTNKKTGAVKYTPNIYMNIFASDDLEAYMAKKGIKLYTPSAGTSIPSESNDEITYYTGTVGRKKLTFYCGYANPINVPLMGRSELRADMEIYVTENGKTTRISTPNYFPCTIGKDVITAEFKLHYQIGATDLGYYQTKKLKVSVTEPPIIGTGEAKHEMSLLRDPYSQSQRLITIPQGDTVNVYDNSGSWYLVGYGGFMGYVAGSSLNPSKESAVIEHVSLFITEPVAGEVWSDHAKVLPEGCTATSVTWFDQTEERFLEAGERFEKGHNYQLVVWASAAEGYKFRLDGNEEMLTTALLNDNKPCITSRAYEQILGKVIDIRFDFVNIKEKDYSHLCGAVRTEQVDATCTKEGVKLHYRCSCGSLYADSAAKLPVSAADLVIPALGHKAGAFTGNGTHHYQKCIRCREVIVGSNAPHKGGTATCLQKAVCDGCGMQYGTVSDHKWSPKHHPIDDKSHAWQCADCKIYDTAIPHTPGPAATESEPQICTDCGYILAPEKNHSHHLTKSPALQADCKSAGNSEYYTCDGCSQWWSDAKGENPILDRSTVITKPLRHFTGDAWHSDEQNHWQSCVICMAVMGEGPAAHSDTNGDGVCEICQYDPKKSPTPPKEEKKSETEAEPQKTEKRGGGWLLPVLVALLSFAAACTVTVIILKKKK